MPPEAVMRKVRGWIAKAESDLLNVRNNLAAPAAERPYDTICFHAQQAAEKYLKALLTYMSTPFPKTHDLSELAVLLPEDAACRDSIGDLAELSYMAIGVRYPDELEEYSEEDASRQVAKAIQVKGAVLEELNRRGFEKGDAA